MHQETEDETSSVETLEFFDEDDIDQEDETVMEAVGPAVDDEFDEDEVRNHCHHHCVVTSAQPHF